MGSSYRECVQLHPGSLVNRVQLQLVLTQDQLLQLLHAGHRSMRDGAELVVLDLEDAQTARKTQWHRV